MTYTAQDIADAISRWREELRRRAGSPGAPITPTILTEEQRLIVAGDTSTCALVTAGAGSGKTETMTMRVLWLVANGHARLDEILGMTFTRRAATSLAGRVREGLDALAFGGMMPTGNDDNATSGLFSASMTTYNAFANRIFSEYGHLAGMDGAAAVMTEATAWQLARAAALDYPGTSLAELDLTLSAVIDATLSVARTLTDNMVATSDLCHFVHDFARHVEPLPITLRGTTHRVPQPAYKKGLTVAARLSILCGVVDAYEKIKRERHLIEFGDQIALAHRLVQIPLVRDQVASSYRFILLDEYQDTSSVQVALLSSLFAGKTVMAVGDPNQAIYGWRGASASNMLPQRFFAAFSPAREGHQFSLSYSWRNAQEVLDVANLVAEPLPRSAVASADGFQLKAGKGHHGSVDVIFPSTIADEAHDIALWFHRKFAEWPSDRRPATAALLTRKTADLLPIKRALEKQGIPTHVLGLGGLFMEPVIVDIVCTLRVMHDTRADSQLIRLLAGARWQISPRDLRALKATARWLSERDHNLQKLSKEVRQSLKDSVSVADGQSLIDALDFITSVTDTTHRAVAELSATGFERMKEAGGVIATLRRHAGMNLRDLVRLVMSEMNLDAELAANDRITAGEASVETFLDTVTSFMTTDNNPTLGSFLSWIDEVERRERLSPVEDEPEGNVVQLLTIHASKGLEWDLVAVGRMIAEDGRTITSNTAKWTDLGTLPEQLRADRADLGRVWDFENATDQRDLEDSFVAYVDSARERYLVGERRLAYVALTRSAHDLLLSGSWWAGGKTRRDPSPYLVEIDGAGLANSPLPPPPTETVNPWKANSETVDWPMPPLGSREPKVKLAEQAVREALADSERSHREPSRLNDDIDLLIAERDRRSQGETRTPLPQRIPASQFKDFVASVLEPQASVADDTPASRGVSPQGSPAQNVLRRPLPQQPYRATMLGTLFHAWVETRSLGAVSPTLFDLDEYIDGDADIGVTSAESRGDEPEDTLDMRDAKKLASLQKTFETSPWAERKPVEVETEIHLPLGPNIVVCKIDAVYQSASSGEPRFEIVDWKTGKAPRDGRDLEARAYQLALYRAAYSVYHGIPEDNIDAVFYFVADDVVIRPDRLLRYDELERLWWGILESSAQDTR
ncbi:MAG: AAA family ATPase [Actinobacteria bacterium]|uniref:DNA 3'-5' helicase n=1 Tax=freshwater metagenome TaxID=449393 RepID=A0A6J7F0K9_9ZZZZ|nr:AAA family ATPase [Actinomycetota bacterium]